MDRAVQVTTDNLRDIKVVFLVTQVLCFSRFEVITNILNVKLQLSKYYIYHSLFHRRGVGSSCFTVIEMLEGKYI